MATCLPTALWGGLLPGRDGGEASATRRDLHLANNVAYADRIFRDTWHNDYHGPVWRRIGIANSMSFGMDIDVPTLDI